MVILFYALKNSLRSSEKFRPITIKLTLAAFSPIFFFSSLDSFKNPIMALIQAYIAHFLYYNSLETGTNLTLKYKTLSEKKMCKKKLQFLSTSHNAFFCYTKKCSNKSTFFCIKISRICSERIIIRLKYAFYGSDENFIYFYEIVP